MILRMPRNHARHSVLPRRTPRHRDGPLQEVIVVVHFGFTTVETWDPERFNRRGLGRTRRGEAVNAQTKNL